MIQNEKSARAEEATFPFRPIDPELMEPGELYLFIRCKGAGAPKELLWGIFARTEKQGELLLESASHDLRHFVCWQLKPAGFDHFRTSTRSELRDYFYNLALRELSTLLEAVSSR